MSVAALVPNHTGTSVYTTPPQSPSALYDPFANPEGLDEIEEDRKVKKERPLTNGIHWAGQDVEKAPNQQDKPPEVPARPASREFPFISSVKKEKESPQLPARPPSQPVGLPQKPTSALPTRAAPTPLRQRTTLPPPTIAEEVVAEGRPGSLKYTRESSKLITYLIPLPKPKYSEHEEALPEVGVICFGTQLE